VIFDPSVCFAHREMDLAMSLLFGGFEQDFYDAYHEVFPLQSGFGQRVEIYQLYYLMVHVNLFGGGYLGSVKNILNRFTGK
jgi:fructosamine-3-kinase